MCHLLEERVSVPSIMELKLALLKKLNFILTGCPTNVTTTLCKHFRHFMLESSFCKSFITVILIECSNTCASTRLNIQNKLVLMSHPLNHKNKMDFKLRQMIFFYMWNSRWIFQVNTMNFYHNYLISKQML